MSPNRPRLWYARQEEAARKRHERLVEQWREIRRLYLAGMELREISRTLGVSVRSVYRYKDLTEPPPRPAHKRRASVLDPYVPYLVRRWNEGCHNGRRLYREIREQGYSHCRTNVDRLLAEFRRASARGRPLSSVPRARRGAVAGSFPSAKNAAALLMRREEVALRTDFVVAKVVEDEDKSEEREEIWGWGARDIVNLLDIRGRMTSMSSSGDVESKG